jgi:hypothetical protein
VRQIEGFRVRWRDQLTDTDHAWLTEMMSMFERLFDQDMSDRAGRADGDGAHP